MLRTCLQSCRLGEFLGSVASPVYLRRHIQVLQKQGVETWTARGHKSGRGSAAAGSPWIVLSGNDRVWHSITLASESARENFASLVWNRAIHWHFYFCTMMLLSSHVQALVNENVDFDIQRCFMVSHFKPFYFGWRSLSVNEKNVNIVRINKMVPILHLIIIVNLYIVSLLGTGILSKWVFTHIIKLLYRLLIFNFYSPTWRDEQVMRLVESDTLT